MCLALSLWSDWLSRSAHRVQALNAFLATVLLAVVAKGFLIPVLGGAIVLAMLAPHALSALCQTVSKPFDIFSVVARFAPLFMITALSSIALYIIMQSAPYGLAWYGGLALFGFQMMVMSLLGGDSSTQSFDVRG